MLEDIEQYKDKYIILYTWNGWDVYLRENPEIPLAGVITNEPPPLSFVHALAMGQKHLDSAISYILHIEGAYDEEN